MKIYFFCLLYGVLKIIIKFSLLLYYFKSDYLRLNFLDYFMGVWSSLGKSLYFLGFYNFVYVVKIINLSSYEFKVKYLFEWKY